MVDDHGEASPTKKSRRIGTRWAVIAAAGSVTFAAAVQEGYGTAVMAAAAAVVALHQLLE